MRHAALLHALGVACAVPVLLCAFASDRFRARIRAHVCTRTTCIRIHVRVRVCVRQGVGCVSVLHVFLSGMCFCLACVSVLHVFLSGILNVCLACVSVLHTQRLSCILDFCPSCPSFAFDTLAFTFRAFAGAVRAALASAAPCTLPRLRTRGHGIRSAGSADARGLRYACAGLCKGELALASREGGRKGRREGKSGRREGKSGKRERQSWGRTRWSPGPVGY